MLQVLKVEAWPTDLNRQRKICEYVYRCIGMQEISVRSNTFSPQSTTMRQSKGKYQVTPFFGLEDGKMLYITAFTL